MEDYCGNGWACRDCYYWLAYGEGPADMTAEELATWENDIAENTKGVCVIAGFLGEDHNEECPRFAGESDVECDCEQDSFSMSPCDMCGGNLGGAREGVTFWKTAERQEDERKAARADLPAGLPQVVYAALGV